MHLRSALGKLQALGIAGVVSYGLLNTLYYSFAFLIVGTTIAKVGAPRHKQCHVGRRCGVDNTRFG